MKTPHTCLLALIIPLLGYAKNGPVTPATFVSCSQIAHGCVDTYTGAYIEVQNDITTRSIEPISLPRVFVSSEETAGEVHGHWHYEGESISVISPRNTTRIAELILEQSTGSQMKFEPLGILEPIRKVMH